MQVKDYALTDMILSFIIDYGKMCGATKSVQHFLCIQDIILQTIFPLLSEWSEAADEQSRVIDDQKSDQPWSGCARSPEGLRTILKFLFAAFKLPSLLSVMFMLNDFLVFRADRVLQLLRVINRCCSQVAAHIRGEEVFTGLQGLRFDCTVLLGILKPQELGAAPGEFPSHNADPGLLPKDEMFTKVVYVLKQEISSSTVSDHQNSLGYNGRDQSLIRDFFETLLQLLLTFDQFCYHDLLVRLCRFPCEVLSCCQEFISKILPQFGRDTRQALKCLNISAVHSPGSVYSQFDNRPSHSDSSIFNSSYQIAVLFRATQKILQSIGLDFQEHQLNNYPQIKLDQKIQISIIDVKLGIRQQISTGRFGSKNRLVRRCSENLLLYESSLYRTSITERYQEFIVENFVDIVDSCCLSTKSEFFALLTVITNFLRQSSPKLDSLLNFIDNFACNIATRALKKWSISQSQATNPHTVPDPPVLSAATARPSTVWRAFVYLQLLIENSDLDPGFSTRLFLFIKANYGMFCSVRTVFSSELTDQMLILHKTLTTLNPEISLSACSSFTDALMSYLTDEEETHEKVDELEADRSSVLDSLWIGSTSRSPTIDWSTGYFEDLNNLLFRKPNRCLLRSVIQKAHFYSHESVMYLVNWVQKFLLGINITQRGLKLVVFFLETIIDILIGKDTAEFNHYQQGRELLSSIFDLETNVTKSSSEQDFKQKLQAMRHINQVVCLLKGYFQLKLELKILQNCPNQADNKIIETCLESIHLAGSPYLRLLVNLFTSHVRRLISGLSIRQPTDLGYVRSWKLTLSAFIKIVHCVKKFQATRVEASQGSVTMSKSQFPKSFELPSQEEIHDLSDPEAGMSLQLKKPARNDPLVIGSSAIIETKVEAVGPNTRLEPKKKKEISRSPSTIIGQLELTLQEIADNIGQNKTKLNADIVSVVFLLIQEYIETFNSYYLTKGEHSDETVLSRYLELIKMADALDSEGVAPKTRAADAGPLHKHKYSLFVLQILIKRIIELEEQIDLFLSYNILQLSLVRVKLDLYDKFELQSLVASVNLSDSVFVFVEERQFVAATSRVLRPLFTPFGQEFAASHQTRPLRQQFPVVCRHCASPLPATRQISPIPRSHGQTFQLLQTEPQSVQECLSDFSIA